MKLCLTALLAISLLATFANAEEGFVQPRGAVTLPYTFPADDGNQWVVQQGGWIQQQGQMPIFGQGAAIIINNAGPQGNVHAGRFDKDTGELVIENLATGGVVITRRIYRDSEHGFLRIIDSYKAKPGQGRQTINVMLQTSINYGISGGGVVNDPRRDDAGLGWVGLTGAGPAAAQMWAGRGSKVLPQINWTPGNNLVQATFKLAVPDNGEVALMHIHAVTPSTEAGETLITQTRDSVFLTGLKPEVRRTIVNFKVATSILGDREILRGELNDVVELRTGDQLRGNLLTPEYKLKTSYSQLSLPADRVVSLLAVGAFKPRHLLVTVDGEVFGGQLEAQSLEFEFASGQKSAIPLSQIARLGYRKRAGEPEEWKFDKPVVQLRTGDRLRIVPPAEPIRVLTRFGPIDLPADRIAAIDMQSTETGSHTINLVDGSRFSGFLTADRFSFELASTGQKIDLPTGAIGAMQFLASSPEPGPETPTLSVSGGDLLVGLLSGQIELNTNFDTVSLAADEVTSLAPLPGSGFDMQVTMWDQTLLSGQPEQNTLAITIAAPDKPPTTVPVAPGNTVSGGLTVNVPLALINVYRNPRPRPSPRVTDDIRKIIADLSVDDFNRREKAQENLLQMGPVVIPILREMRPTVPLEARQRIDDLLAKLSKSS